ncbi:hypothetical protein ACRALDRAFT_204850 [Sodiomyces alcalophilus JCM 7366]|uniref:uncharacterized protein n=1 Tax=Sodiomyces alcalophilus JCM 7366 TaxID=591952 RepID=UPI0039B53059
MYPSDNCPSDLALRCFPLNLAVFVLALALHVVHELCHGPDRDPGHEADPALLKTGR